MDRWGEYWRVTDASVRKLFGEVFGPENVEVEVGGNVLSACAFLHGMVVADLTQAELEYVDPDYQLIVAVRAVRRGAARITGSSSSSPESARLRASIARRASRKIRYYRLSWLACLYRRHEDEVDKVPSSSIP
jgi:hypothetical protein